MKQSLDASEIADLEVSGHVKFQAIYEIHQILSYPFAGRLLSRLQFLLISWIVSRKPWPELAKATQFPIESWFVKEMSAPLNIPLVEFRIFEVRLFFKNGIFSKVRYLHFQDSIEKNIFSRHPCDIPESAPDILPLSHDPDSHRQFSLPKIYGPNPSPAGLEETQRWKLISGSQILMISMIKCNN